MPINFIFSFKHTHTKKKEKKIIGSLTLKKYAQYLKGKISVHLLNKNSFITNILYFVNFLIDMIRTK